MRAILYPSEISGRVAAPPSKSMAHRALICAALAKGESRVLNLSASQDITATLAAMRLLGASAADMDAPECRRGAAAAYAHWSGERTVSGPGSLILKERAACPLRRCPARWIAAKAAARCGFSSRSFPSRTRRYALPGEGG